MAETTEQPDGAHVVLQRHCSPSITLTMVEAAQLLALFGGEDAEISVQFCEQGHDGPGLYAHFSDCPEEGSMRLDPDLMIQDGGAGYRGAVAVISAKSVEQIVEESKQRFGIVPVSDG